MEESVYSKLPKLKVELSLTTLVVGTLIILFAFIIPVALIQSYQNSPKTKEPEIVDVVSGPSVAGASTIRESGKINLPIINQEVSLEGQSGVLILLGIILLGLSFFIILFLIIDSLKRKPKLN